MSNQVQFRKDLKRARYVYGYVVITEHDGVYLQLNKSDVKYYANKDWGTAEIKYRFAEDTEDVYIN